jgi:hypothetical protein
MTICARSCLSGTAMAAVETAFIPAFSTALAIAVSVPGYVRRIERRPRARSSASSATCGTAFHVPLASRLAQEGLIVDRETANLAVKRWLREVANARIHGTTGAIPAERLVNERLHLQPIPLPYGGRSVRSLQAKPERVPIIGIQHPLALYDALAGGVRLARLQHQRLGELCRELRLSAVPDLYSAIAQRAAAQTASFTDFLEEILRGERDAGRAHARDVRPPRRVPGGQDARRL